MRPVIVLDPGHGGIDPGAVGRVGKTEEEDITLSIALKIKEYLSPVATAILTRKTDVALSQEARADIANKMGASAFVAVHCNSSEKISAKGTEIYYYMNSDKGKLLAARIFERLPSALGLFSRGMKEADFTVLSATKCPACLVEIAFISNSHEESLLKTADFQDRAAWAIAEGIASYLGVHLRQVKDQKQIPDNETTCPKCGFKFSN